MLKMMLLGLTLAVGACATTGTKPADMTAAQHREQCAKHRKVAADYDQRAKLDGGKEATIDQRQASEHAVVARQHGEAAQKVDRTAAAESGNPTPSVGDPNKCE